MLAVRVLAMWSSLLDCISLSRLPRLFLEGVTISVTALPVLKLARLTLLGVGVLMRSDSVACCNSSSLESRTAVVSCTAGSVSGEMVSELALLVVGETWVRLYPDLRALSKGFVSGEGIASSPFSTASIVLTESKSKGWSELVRTESGRYACLLAIGEEEAGVSIVPSTVVLLFSFGRSKLVRRAARGEKLSLQDTCLKGRGESKCFRSEDVREGVHDAASKAGAAGADGELAQFQQPILLSLNIIH